MLQNPSIDERVLTGVLSINDLVVPVRIGVTEEERSKPQDISLSIKLTFNKLPNGVFTDNINDTICYHRLCDEISAFLKEKEFSLIEKLCGDLYNLLRKNNLFSSIALNVSKKPNIHGLRGCVSMELSGL